MESWLDSALNGLASIQSAARAVDFSRRVPRIGARPGWLENLINAPERIGERLGLPAPRLPADELRWLLDTENDAFVKWDARPTNAKVRGDGIVAWFDWKHCGRHDPMDDVAWLLGDEHTPDNPELESRLLDRHTKIFAGDHYKGDPYHYLSCFGTLHMCIRMHVVLNSVGDSRWASMRPDGSGLADDATNEAIRRTCQRGARWARRSPLTEPLADWLSSVPAMVSTAPALNQRRLIHPETATIH